MTPEPLAPTAYRVDPTLSDHDNRNGSRIVFTPAAGMLAGEDITIEGVSAPLANFLAPGRVVDADDFRDIREVVEEQERGRLITVNEIRAAREAVRRGNSNL